MTLLKDLLALFYLPHRVGSDKNKRSYSSNHVLRIGTDRDPFVFALSSCSGVRPSRYRTRVLSHLSSDNSDVRPKDVAKRRLKGSV